MNATVADIREFELPPRRFHSRIAGLFLLLPYLVALDLDSIVKKSKLPGTRMIPATHAVRSALALKLVGTERKSHVYDLIFDEGLALFSGLNTSPKKSFLSEYSGRVDRKMDLRVLSEWLATVRPDGLIEESSYNLDFHSVPFFGEDEFIEKHYVSQRSRSQKSVLTIFAQDAGSKEFCYFNADLLKGEENDEVLAFVDYWETATGKRPQHLVFDSRLTTYGNLNRLNKMDIKFMTLRRREKKLLADISTTPASAWQKINLDIPQRKFKTPRVIEKMVKLTGYEGDVRQFYIQDLGHDFPTILLTNDMKPTPRQLITRYAQRMVIENSLAESVDFFHLDALSSAVPLKVDFDVLLTVLASGLYRAFAKSIRGYKTAKARQLFRRFIDTPGDIQIEEDGVTVFLPKRAHNPLLSAAGFFDKEVPIPWWFGRPLRLRQA
ncbi:MAG: transposase [Rectinemataceae bacterium]|nr:transposase [Rectinemataceae bacterium]